MTHSRAPSRAAVLMLAALLSACASGGSVRYYTLVSPMQGATLPSPPPASAPARVLAVEVLPVRVPATVDVQTLVVRQGNGALAHLETARWSGPLPDELRSAVSTQLQARLGARDVYGLPSPSSPPATPVPRVRIVLQRLDAWPSNRIDLEAQWRIESGDAGVQCATRISQPIAATGAEAIVDGYQRAIAMLATQMAPAVVALANAQPARCPA